MVRPAEAVAELGVSCSVVGAIIFVVGNCGVLSVVTTVVDVLSFVEAMLVDPADLVEVTLVVVCSVGVVDISELAVVEDSPMVAVLGVVLEVVPVELPTCLVVESREEVTAVVPISVLGEVCTVDGAKAEDVVKTVVLSVLAGSLEEVAAEEVEAS